MKLNLHYYYTPIEKIFGKPTQLPPNMQQDHAIPLTEGSNLVKVLPYRCLHHQKELIAKMVGEMLEVGIIQPSTSPSSFPILLVKKDGTWHSYTDYRALNTVR